MKISKELQERGFIHQHTGDSLAELTDSPPRTIYHGIDPSADSAHVGNLTVWILLRHLVRAGHKVVFLVGGGTGMIGDPKPDAERVLIEESKVEAQVVKLTKQAQRLVGGDEQTITFVDNKTWLGDTYLLTFLRDIGKHFTVNELIKKDAIAKRLQSDVGISYTEFAYPLLQAYDYLTLYRNQDCTLQVGGSDQWGNIVSGVELVRRVEGVAVHALTTPLITDKATGKKFGKSEGNAVWLDKEKTSPYQFYQFWLNVSDASVEEYLKIFTVLSLTEIATIVDEWQADPATRLAQKRLAHAVTEFVHGSEVATAVQAVSECVFGAQPVADLSVQEMALLKEQLPFVSIAETVTLVEAVVTAGLATSKREARTFIESGAITIDGTPYTDTAAVIATAVKTVPYLLLRRGKKAYALVEVSN